MALITTMSAKGAPGTTTVTLLLATLWAAPTVVLDADPLGGDMGLRLQRADGHAMDPDRGLMSLVPAARRGLTPETVSEHAQEAVGGQPVLTGVPGPDQAVAVAPLWPQMIETFARMPEQDMFIDAGQVHSRSEQLPLALQADALLCVYRPTAWSALHLRQRLEGLADQVRDHGVRVGLVAVARADEERDRQNAASAIADGFDWVTDFGAVAWDPRAVGMFEGATVYRPERTLLARSGRAVAEKVYADLASAYAPREQVLAAVPDASADSHEAAVGRHGAGRRARRRARQVAGEPKEVS